MARMVRKQIYLDPRQDEILKAAADRTGKTESELIRNAIDESYDAEAVRHGRQARVESWRKHTAQFAEFIAASGGIEPWDREGLHDPLPRRPSGSS